MRVARGQRPILQRRLQARVGGLGDLRQLRARGADGNALLRALAAHAQRQRTGDAVLHEHAVDWRGQARLQPHARCRRWMAGERDLLLRAEHAQPVAGACDLRREHEGGLGQARPARNGLHAGIVQAFGIKHHGQRIAGTGARGEHIQLQETAGGHQAGLQ